MVRSFLPILFIPAFAEESLMQFEKAADLDLIHTSVATRTSNMHKSTKAMEDQYKAILLSIVESKSWSDPKTGNPWVPDKALVLDPVDGVITDMEEELEGQRTLNTDIMGRHTQSIVQCNTERDNALNGVVTENKNTMKSDRTSHSTCRGLEDTEISDMESDCATFVGMNRCGHEQNWYAALDAGQGGAGSLAAIISQAEKCRTGIADTSAKAHACDGAQDSFKDSFCAYAQELKETCDTHTSCYDTNTANWDQADGTIKQLETEQKTIYRMLGRIRCYLKLLLGAADGSIPPAQQDIETCQGTSVADSILDVVYGAKAPRGKCYDADAVKDERTEDLPGTNNWYNAELKAYEAHGKLQENTGC